MVSNIVQPPKLPTRQLWGDFQGKTGPVALILRFFNCNILLTNTRLARNSPQRHEGTKLFVILTLCLCGKNPVISGQSLGQAAQRNR
jgi:hypothetical protein